MSVVSEVVRQQVRKRANDRCEYCHKPNIVSLYGYHVDHIVPLKHGGTSAPNNLAWACFECNVSKGRDISSYDEITGELTPLFNPRIQRWETHFKFVDAFIQPQTAVGRVTVRILDLNRPEAIEARERMMKAGDW